MLYMVDGAMILALLASVSWIVIETTDGKQVELNTNNIVAFRVPRSTDMFAPGAKCLVFTGDGRFINSANTCEEIHLKLEGE